MREEFSVADLKMEGTTWQERQTASERLEWLLLTAAIGEVDLSPTAARIGILPAVRMSLGVGPFPELSERNVTWQIL